MDSTRRLGTLALAAGLLAGMLAMSAAPSVLGATTCRVRNVTQGSTGTSLIRMVERAEDGDLIRVRGTCPGEVVIDVDLVIEGWGVGPTISGGGRTRGVHVLPGATVTLRGLAIRDGAAGYGGGIVNAGTLTVARVSIRDSRAGPRHGCGLVPDPTCDYRRRGWNAGGGIANEGTLTLVASRVIRDEAGKGGGIVNRGTLTMTRSTVARNSASAWSETAGGGILNEGTLRVRRSTIARNTVVSGEGYAMGGGIFNSGPLSLSDSTVSGNVAYGQNGGGGGGIANGSVYWGGPGEVVLEAVTVSRNEARTWTRRHQDGSGIGTCHEGCGYEDGSVTVVASIIAGNGRDCAGPFTSLGHNLVGVAPRACEGFTDGVAHDQVGTVAEPLLARLAPLAENGGLTETHALMAGSPAVDAAGASPCATETDQRGVVRPRHGRCDAGAFEAGR